MRRLTAAVLGGVLLAGLAVAQAQDRTGPEVELGGLKSKVPAAWKQEQPSSNMRLTQFRLPHADGDGTDAEVVVFYFGQGGAGDDQANVDRQLVKFVPPQGKTAREAAKMSEFQVGGQKATVVDLSGTYKFKAQPFNPNAKEELRPDYRLVYVILPTPKGPHYVQIVGPARTVEKHKAGFDEWVKNFK
jgi:hypothetical protein